MAHSHYYPLSKADPSAQYMKPNLLYTGCVTNIHSWRSSTHIHDFPELLYVAAGEMEFIVGDNVYLARRGSLVLCNPHILHAEKAVGDTLLRLEFFAARGFQFTGLSADHLLPDDACPLLPCTGFSRQIAGLFSDLLAETQNNQLYSSLIAQSLTINILSLSQRIFKLHQQTDSTASEKISLVKQFIDENFAESLNLDSLSKLFNISKYHLAHLFKAQVGTSPMRYLTHCRMHHACQLLKNSTQSIEQIAQQSGYFDTQYFHRLFRQSIGMTPGNYRRNFLAEMSAKP